MLIHKPCTREQVISSVLAIFRRGPATAVEAVGDGRIAAQAIDRFFNGDMNQIPAKPFNSRKQKQLKAVDPEQYKSIQRMARKIMPELTPEQREQSFDEVETGFDNAGDS